MSLGDIHDVSADSKLEKLMPKNESKQEEQNLIVGLRIRPMNEDEIIAGATPVAHKVDDNMVVLMDPTDDPDDILRANRSREKQYVFDVAFDGSATQKEVYEKTTKFLIPNVVNGYNATVFAYGATGAGKTYTMLGTAEERGIMARTMNDLFLEMEKTQEDMAYRVTVSFLEIYNEMIRDLLCPSSGVLELREDSNGVQVAGLSKFQAKSTREIMDILIKGNKQRTQEPTVANKTSSRSHAVLQITVRQKNRIRDNTVQEVRMGKLFLIDLAGSERAANTQNRGKRMVEGAHINRSLLALGNCINALSDKHARKYVNYRDSKLTRLLKDALGGNTKTVMIATISPASIHFEESRNTLVYADRAKNIKTKVRRNVMDVSYHIAQYSNIISELREEIKRLRTKLDQKSEQVSAMQPSRFDTGSANYDDVEKLKNQLVQIFSHQMGLRRSLMELDNKSMELSLEESKNSFLIQKWEREKGVLRRRNSMDDLSKYKEMELAGDGTEEPDDVAQAREELEALRSEERKIMEKRESILRDLNATKNKASKVEQMLPNLVSTSDQQEILRLLCKIHELEMENVHMQSSCLLRNMDIRQRELAIEQYKHHHTLADELIQHQRTLMDEKNIPIPKDLEELYELYQQEGNEILEIQFSLPDIHAYKNSSGSSINHKMLETETVSEMDESTSAVHLPKIFVPYNGANSVARKQLLKKSSLHINRLEEEDAFFAKSPRALQFGDQKTSDSTVSLSPPPVTVQGKKNPRQKSILTLSSRSTATTPSPPANDIVPAVNSSTESVPAKEERHKIAVNTRNIAALAAKRKNLSNINMYNKSQDPSFFMTETSVGQQNESGYLTQSRLAQHDKKYGSSVGVNNLNDDDFFSDSADTELVPTKASVHKRNIYQQEQMRKKRAAKQKPVQKDFKPNYQQMTPEEFFKQLSRMPPKKQHFLPGNVHREARSRSKLPAANVSKVYARSKAQQNKESNGEVTQRTETTDRESRGQKKHPLPSIPTYRKGDISVTGHSLHQ